MNTQLAPQLQVAKSMLSNLAAELVAGIDAAGTVDERLSAAQAVEQELAEVSAAIELAFGTAKLTVATRASELKAESDAQALARVVALLDAGSITLADLASRMSSAPQSPVVALHVVPTPAPAPEVVLQASPSTPAAPAAQVDASLPQEIRENLRLQAGYMHPVKYRDPATGAGWSGRGPTPKWLKALLVDGKTLADFAANAPVQQAQATPVEVVAEPAAEVQQEAAADAAVALESSQEAVVSNDVSIDIGEDLGSFDASNMVGDMNAAPMGLDDDIGEIVSGIASMPLGGSSSAAFLAAA